ncbi:sugar ABC transporter substrate-binding protein [Saccharibacillus sp. CPCC 101409]|uniref:ABC transporter substrate-binding protein n=1 Tax=Saccharibacillus sp. CPCC 101409 TaxID=3058041 RepID=UPI002671F302|nr:sugar ABC transporter substrate-binding protein [Saccharibacillus sp. CPCC 101409]MDO3412202.1 sugar ABC transporter substrate-binding protein [Saccharibacillus sp. CPCC 101409]
MKKAAGLITSAALVLSLLSGCGGKNDTASTNAGGDNKASGGDTPVTLRMSWWGSDARNEYTQQVIDLYEKEHTNVKIEVEYAAFDDYWKKLAPQAAANQLPDIMQMDISYISQYANNGQLEDLTSYAGSQINTADVAENVLSTGNVNDKLYGVPVGVNVLGFQYDPSMMEKAGISEIPKDWDWDTYQELAKKAGAAGIYFDSSMAPDIFFHYYLRTKGFSLYNAEGNALGYDDDKLFEDFFGMLVEMIKAKAVPTQDILTQTKGIVEENDIVKGKGIGMWQWSNQYVALQQAVNRPMELAPMPGPDMEKGLYMQPSMYFSIASSSKQKEEAAKFIDFWVNDVEANKLIMGERGVPISSKVKEALTPELSETAKQVFDFVTEMEPLSSPMSPPAPAGSSEVREMLGDYAEQMNFEQITPAEAAAKFRGEANAILANNQ